VYPPVLTHLIFQLMIISRCQSSSVSAPVLSQAFIVFLVGNRSLFSQGLNSPLLVPPFLSRRPPSFFFRLRLFLKSSSPWRHPGGDFPSKSSFVAFLGHFTFFLLGHPSSLLSFSSSSLAKSLPPETLNFSTNQPCGEGNDSLFKIAV